MDRLVYDSLRIPTVNRIHPSLMGQGCGAALLSFALSLVPSWPKPLAEAAFHGLAGDIVHLIEPHSEADPAALLLQLLIGFGNMVGRSPHVMVEADRHGANLFGVLVGQSSKARKGVSWG